MRDQHDPGTVELPGFGEARCVGFARPHSGDSDQSRQVRQLRAAGCVTIASPARLDKTIQGAVRTDLAALATSLSSGDVLVVERVHVLANDVASLLALLTDLRDRRIRLRALHEGLDTATPSGGFFLHAVAQLAECHQAWAKERRRRGGKAAAARGALGGRPVSVSDERLAAVRAWMASNGKGVAEAARFHDIRRSTLYRLLGLRRSGSPV